MKSILYFTTVKIYPLLAELYSEKDIFFSLVMTFVEGVACFFFR